MDDPDLDWIVQNKKTTNRQLLMSHPTESEDMAKLLTAHAAFKKGSYDVAVNTLRYQDPLGHVEFVFNKKIFTESTDLINHYIALDPRVGKLVAVVKNFVQLRSVAKGKDIGL
jgi:hypothetical protein